MLALTGQAPVIAVQVSVPPEEERLERRARHAKLDEIIRRLRALQLSTWASSNGVVVQVDRCCDAGRCLADAESVLENSLSGQNQLELLPSTVQLVSEGSSVGGSRPPTCESLVSASCLLRQPTAASSAQRWPLSLAQWQTKMRACCGGANSR